MDESVSIGRKLAAWGVHAYTALGLPLAFIAMAALGEGDARTFFLAQIAACFVDATDGTLARRLQVKKVLPSFDGRRLDDIIDFINFAFLPALALPALNMVPAGWAWVAVVPLLASAYGFSQDNAKTEESFVGFPSYWNVLVLYFFALGTDPRAAAAVVLILSALVFVPIHYLYPSKTRLLKPVTVIGGSIWAGMMTAVAIRPDATWTYAVALASLAYPVYYFALSFVHHARIKRETAFG